LQGMCDRVLQRNIRKIGGLKMTDKKRLEEAKLMAEMLRVETRLPHDFPFDLVDWLVEQAERVQELESRIADDEHFVAEILEQNRRYREVINQIKNNIPLEFKHISEYEA